MFILDLNSEKEAEEGNESFLENPCAVNKLTAYGLPGRIHRCAAAL